VVILYWEENNFCGSGKYFLLFSCKEKKPLNICLYISTTLIINYELSFVYTHLVGRWLTVFSGQLAQVQHVAAQFVEALCYKQKVAG
jgi:hypothetical protein